MIGHSTILMVPEGLLVTSSTTRFTPGTSLVIRVDIRASSWQTSRVRSAVMASSLDTGRSTTGCLGGCCAVIAVQCPTCSLASDPSLDPSERRPRSGDLRVPYGDREVRLQPEQTAELTDLVDHRQAGALLDERRRGFPGAAERTRTPRTDPPSLTGRS